LNSSRVHWKTLWEEYAAAERKTFDSMPVETLLEMVAEGRYGNYYKVWYSIAGRAALEQAGIILMEILHRDIDYLYRYHCAAALLALMNEMDFQPADLSAGHSEQSSNLIEIQRRLDDLLGISK
jgi:hypothetical protein